MTILFYAANALVMATAMFLVVNYYKLRKEQFDFRKLPIAISIILLTTLVTSAQFIFPEIIPALDRNKEALMSGEVWRLITPLFIQPMGLWQCVFNGVFFVTFLPAAEQIYGRRLLIIYFGCGIAGQLANYYWSKGGGGSSTAIYGTIGSLYMYFILCKKNYPSSYTILPIAGFLGATILCFFKDGHAPSLLIGGIMSLALYRRQAAGSITA